MDCTDQSQPREAGPGRERKRDVIGSRMGRTRRARKIPWPELDASPGPHPMTPRATRIALGQAAAPQAAPQAASSSARWHHWEVLVDARKG
ncbi:hypothetical protein L204_103027 [Cryptococcus depauperatus]|nr:hypothetical protein L204_00227 [Cryptococcus depauperatus CBS 7855]